MLAPSDALAASLCSCSSVTSLEVSRGSVCRSGTDGCSERSCRPALWELKEKWLPYRLRMTWHWCVRLYACAYMCARLKTRGWRRKRASRVPEFPSVWPSYWMGALQTQMLGSAPTPPHPHPLAVRPHLPHRRDDNKHVSRHTPGQSAIRFTVHEIWWCFYWSKDLSVIIYRLFPRRLWCQRAPCALERISRGGGVKEIAGEGWWLCWGLEI